MPLSANIGQDYAEDVARLYRDAELRILARITAALRRGIDTPDWEREALGRAQEVRERTIRELNRVNPMVARALTASLTDAYSVGSAAALRDIGKGLSPLAATPPARVAAVTALTRDVATGLSQVGPAVLRQVDDVFRATVAAAVQASATGGTTRIAAAQTALRELTARGISNIPVARGTMNMTDYLSMATRTAASRAAITGTTDTMTASDIDLVVIHPGPRACDICDDWARNILSIQPGPEGVIRVAAVDGSGEVEVEVSGSLDDARTDGWGHPNCRCAVAAYLPGVTDADIIERPKWDEDGYVAQQQQRTLERGIRQAKTSEATALTDEAAAEAKAEVRSAQAELRAHLEAHDELKRQSSREQIGRVL